MTRRWFGYEPAVSVGSDVPRVLSDGAHGYPIIVGHEFSGQVIAVGKAVKDVTVGARATVAPLVPCGVCDACAAGHPAMCTHYSFIGSRQDGAMAEYVAVPRTEYCSDWR